MSQKDKYNFSLLSPMRHPGFESFKSEKDKGYYFHLNDENGMPVLFSQKYRTKTSQEKGLLSVYQNALDESRIVQLKDGKKAYFIVRAGNNQEIARSKSFDTDKAMAKAVKYLQDVIRKEDSDRKETKALSNRFRFNLTFRSAGGKEPLRGEMEFPLEGDKISFEGLDLQKISGFIAKYLPSSKELKSKTIPSIQGYKLPKKIEILEQGKITEKQVLRKSVPVEVQMNIAETDHLPSDGFEAIVHAKSMKRGEFTLIGEKKGAVSNDGFVKVPIVTDTLHPGPYRINFTVKFNAPRKPQGEQLVEGSRVVQIF